MEPGDIPHKMNRSGNASEKKSGNCNPLPPVWKGFGGDGVKVRSPGEDQE